MKMTVRFESGTCIETVGALPPEMVVEATEFQLRACGIRVKMDAVGGEDAMCQPFGASVESADT